MKILLLIPALILVVASLALPAQAARQQSDAPTDEAFSVQSVVTSPLVERLQRALRMAKYYNGPISGSLNAATKAAIRSYQQNQNLNVDGAVTEQLVTHMESSVKVLSLLQQLQRQRLLKIAAARKALMQSPETRRLLNGDKETTRTADPTRDPAPCFRDPGPRCLLAEASESARAIFKNELRNWALSEILVAEAKAGLLEVAMNTVRRIEDPRLMLVALRDIAEAQASGGRPVEALAAAAIIPEPVKRAEALAAIAAIQASGSPAAALRTVKILFQAVELIDIPLKHVALLSQGAIIQYRSGDTRAAAATLTRALKIANDPLIGKTHGVSLRHVANALAETARPEQALAVLKNLPERSEHTPVLVSAASAQAQAGDAVRALATAEAITSFRYKTVVLGRIALAQAVAGQLTAADETLERALAAIESIELPFARAYAHERIALNLIGIAKMQNKKQATESLKRAVTLAGRIGDNRLRARTLWTIADAERHSGRIAAAKRTEKLASTATATIRSQLTRVWMFCNLALDRHQAAAPKLARRAFDKALAISENIGNPWGRARALARLASTLVDLSLVK